MTNYLDDEREDSFLSVLFGSKVDLPVLIARSSIIAAGMITDINTQ